MPCLQIILIEFLYSNNRNKLRWAILGLPQDGVCTTLFENFSVNSLKRDLTKNAIFNPPIFSLVTFRVRIYEGYLTYNIRYFFHSFNPRVYADHIVVNCSPLFCFVLHFKEAVPRKFSLCLLFFILPYSLPLTLHAQNIAAAARY